MVVKVTARGFKADDTTREFAEETAQKFLKFSDDVTKVEVILSEENTKDHQKSCEYILSVKGNGSLVVKEMSHEISKAIHDAGEKVVRQLRKLRTKDAPDKAEAGAIKRSVIEVDEE